MSNRPLKVPTFECKINIRNSFIACVSACSYCVGKVFCIVGYFYYMYIIINIVRIAISQLDTLF